MGRSDNILYTHYRSQIEPQGDVALLGYTNNNWFSGDLYDRSLDNWNINSPWELPKKYDDYSIAYFPHMDIENGIQVSLNLECTKP